MRKTPLVSVVMATYNSDRYLTEALNSIYTQTFRDYEFIIINDGSTDGTAQILYEAARRDSRLQINTFRQNQGTVASINQGLALSHGKYIARMDSDDICRPDRFEKQVHFMETHPEVGLLGSGITLIDPKGRELGKVTYPSSDYHIRWASLLSNPFAQPTMMIRQIILSQNNLQYRPRQAAEDYDLWVRALRYTQGANLSDPLVRYRVHPASASSQLEELKNSWHTVTSYENIRFNLPEFVISPEDHAILVSALDGFLKNMHRVKRPLAARLYLQLWRAFAACSASNSSLRDLQRETTVLAAKIGLYPPFLPGWSSVLRDLFALEPLWFASFIIRFPHMVSLKLRGFRLRHLRKTG